jgi:hypothetical protein
MKRNWRIPGLILLFFVFMSVAAKPFAQVPAPKDKLIYFFSQSCHLCHAVKEGVLAAVGRDYGSRIEIEYRDIGDMENYKLLLGLRNKIDPAGQIQVPAVYFGGQLLIGKDKIEKTLLQLIQPGTLVSPPVSSAQIPAVDLEEQFMTFTPVAVVGAGLIDGINPCAFTVIVFFISFLSLQGYSRRELAFIGSSFITAVFLTYLLLGLGLFSFFYSLKGVMMVRALLNLCIGIFTLLLGVLAVRDIFTFVSTGKTEDMLLQLPGAVKRQIHKVIGLAYRKPAGASFPQGRRPMGAVFATAFVTGFLVSLLEAVCTGQVYLPTITYVLKTAPVKFQAAGYLVLYNVMFIVPLVAIFMLALAGVRSGELSQFLRKHFLLTKVLLAGMFFVLGFFLIWRG